MRPAFICWLDSIEPNFKASGLQGCLLHLQCKSVRSVIAHDCCIILCIASPLSFSIFFRWLSSGNDFSQFKLNASCDLWWSRLPALILASLAFILEVELQKVVKILGRHTGLKIENEWFKLAFVCKIYANYFNIIVLNIYGCLNSWVGITVIQYVGSNKYL